MRHLREQGFSDSTINAIGNVQREDFVNPEFHHLTYYEDALPLEMGATVSQPSTIAAKLDLLELKKAQMVLEIGSGCGYVLAVLAEITRGEIFGVEIIDSHAEKSKHYLKKHKNIIFVTWIGSQELPDKAPFDRILISASCSKMPTHLYSQLTEGGSFGYTSSYVLISN